MTGLHNKRMELTSAVRGRMRAPTATRAVRASSLSRRSQLIRGVRRTLWGRMALSQIERAAIDRLLADY
ncbi:MAG TPA: hypothetical protein VGQ93_12915, partial [Lysobacter sp.]|nr:hypothetical protein [Lysobacter sp.]